MAVEKADLDRLRGQLDGELLADGDPGWDAARGAFNVLLDQRPAAIVLALDDADVAATVAFAGESGLRVAAQSTGHNAAPLGSLAETVLIRTAGLRGGAIDAGAGIARARAGDRWADVIGPASTAGLTALHGSGPGIGLVGYTLGGGVGWYGRSEGLAANRVTAVELVGADAARRLVDAGSDPELFWALRGANAGNFGVVTALEFELLPIAEVYGGALMYPLERAAEVLHGWREWTDFVPDEMTSLARIVNYPPIEAVPEPVRGKSFALVEAVFPGAEAEGEELMAPLRRLGPAIDSVARIPAAAAIEIHRDPPDPIPYASDHLLLSDLPHEAIDAMLTVVGPGSGSRLTSVEVRHTGGALARADEGHGALATLPGSFAVFGVGAILDPAAAEPTVARLGELCATLGPWDAGRFLPFTDRETPLSAAFDEATVERLRAAKRRYDPDGLFHASHAIGA